MRSKEILSDPGRRIASTALHTESEECMPGTKRRGRPCQIAEGERRELLIEAAESVFLELGYSAANMDDIAHRAGMSKKTLYRLFETKESLFAAVVAARRASLSATIDAGDCPDAKTAGETLRRFLGAMARFVLAPRQAALYRLVIAESQRAPELAHAFHCEGPSKARSPLTIWLALQHQRGTLCVPDPPSAAGMLFSMVIGELQMRLLIGEIRAADEGAIDRRVRCAVELFINGAQPRK